MISLIAILSGKASAAETYVVIVQICAVGVVCTRVGRAGPGVLLADVSLDSLWACASEAIVAIWKAGSAVVARCACAMVAFNVAQTTWYCLVWFGGHMTV